MKKNVLVYVHRVIFWFWSWKPFAKCHLLISQTMSSLNITLFEKTVFFFQCLVLWTHHVVTVWHQWDSVVLHHLSCAYRTHVNSMITSSKYCSGYIQVSLNTVATIHPWYQAEIDLSIVHWNCKIHPLDLYRVTIQRVHLMFLLKIGQIPKKIW